MYQDSKKLSGKAVSKRLHRIVPLSDIIGVPIVAVFLLYNLSGSWSAFSSNWKIFVPLLTITVFYVVAGVTVFGWSINRNIKETLDFLNNDERMPNESEEDYLKRVSRALACTLRFPFKQSLVTMVTWPSILVLIMITVWVVFFKFPLGMMALLFSGALCASMLIAVFRFYFFKRGLEETRAHILHCYPGYWRDPVLQEVKLGLRPKLLFSFTFLMLITMYVVAVLAFMDAGRAVMFQWGESQKKHIMNELKDVTNQLVEATTPDERANLLEPIISQTEGTIFLVNRDGESQLPGEIGENEKEALRKIAKLSFSLDHDILIAPFAKDKDIIYSSERGKLAVSVRLELPETDYLVIVRAKYDDLRALLGQMVTMSVLVVVFAVFLSVFFTKVASDDVINPVKTLGRVVEKVSRGELAEEIGIATQDELGILAVNVKRMMENLRGMILQISQAAASVETATLSIVEGFKRVSEGSRMQSSSVDETSAAMDEMNASIKGIGENVETLASTAQESSTSILEMSATIEQVADNVENLSSSVEETTSSIGEMAASIRQVAENVENLSRKAESTVSSVTQMEVSIQDVKTRAEETVQISELVAKNAESGALRVQSTIEGIDRARNFSQQAVQVIQELAERASEIGNILTVIEDVTDETNLLALNAAIIAAQAGEHGKGFAVVADEIKDLAERTAQSTEEIGQLIEAVQKGAKEAVEAVRLGYKSVEEGVALSKEAGDALATILESASRSANRAHEIARSTVEQAERTREVLQFFEEISDNIRHLEIATREQSKGSAQIMKSAEQMRDIAKHVKKATHEQFLGSKQIIQAIENINQIIAFIERSQDEQIHNTESVVEAVQEIRRIAAQNEEGVEEMFKASANLSSLAEDLRGMVEAFKVHSSLKHDKD